MAKPRGRGQIRTLKTFTPRNCPLGLNEQKFREIRRLDLVELNIGRPFLKNLWIFLMHLFSDSKESSRISSDKNTVKAQSCQKNDSQTKPSIHNPDRNEQQKTTKKARECRKNRKG